MSGCSSALLSLCTLSDIKHCSNSGQWRVLHSGGDVISPLWTILSLTTSSLSLPISEHLPYTWGWADEGLPRHPLSTRPFLLFKSCCFRVKYKQFARTTDLGFNENHIRDYRKYWTRDRLMWTHTSFFKLASGVQRLKSEPTFLSLILNINKFMGLYNSEYLSAAVLVISNIQNTIHKSPPLCPPLIICIQSKPACALFF